LRSSIGFPRGSKRRLEQRRAAVRLRWINIGPAHGNGEIQMTKVNSAASRTRLAAALAMLFAGVALAGPNSPGGTAAAPGRIVAKASGVTMTNINLTVDTCNGVSGTLTVTATGTTDDGGGNDTIWFTIFDDGVEKFSRQLSVPVGSTVGTTVTVSYPGQIGSSAPGIGLLVGESDGSSDLAEIDPFFPESVGGCSALPAAIATPALSPWSMGGLAGLLALMGFGTLYARRRNR